MKNKVTLITPPDIFENSNKSVMVVDLTTQEQDDLSVWLGEFLYQRPSCFGRVT